MSNLMKNKKKLYADPWKEGKEWLEDFCLSCLTYFTHTFAENRSLIIAYSLHNIVSNCANWLFFTYFLVSKNKTNRRTNLKMIKNYCYDGEKFGW